MFSAKRADDNFLTNQNCKDSNLNIRKTVGFMDAFYKSEYEYLMFSLSTVIAWDYYTRTKDRKEADEMMHKWMMAKLALKFITGEFYGVSRDGETVSLVNERNYNDKIFIGKAHK